MNMNGGFPPVKYCKEEIKDSKDTKSRFFSNAPKQNVNIRDILSQNNTPTLLLQQTDSDIEIVDEI